MARELSTERLLLRGLEPRDAPALFSIFSDPQTVAYTEWEPFQTIASAEWLIHWANTAESQEPQTIFAWAIQWHDAADGELLGIVTLTVRDPEQREASLGYMVNRALWGRGIAPEAVSAVIASAFHDLQLHRITAGCRPENTASARVMEKVGMCSEGHLVKNRWEKGRWCDTLVFALVEEEVLSR